LRVWFYWLFLKNVQRKNFLIESESGQRLDVFLSRKIPGLSRSKIKELIHSGRVTIENRTAKPSHQLRSGEHVAIMFSLEEPAFHLIPQDIPLDIIYQDSCILVINKQAGIVVHPGAGNPAYTLANALMYHFPEGRAIGPENRPGIVHRLDKETSGVMVVARDQNTYDYLKRQFKQRKVDKRYAGLVWGNMPGTEGELTWPIGRHIRKGILMSVKTAKPRAAHTFYWVKKRFQQFTLLDIKPTTGRTHQIRVHLATAGHPLVGDNRYGKKNDASRAPRLCLHASTLAFAHPQTGLRMDFSAPLPEDLEKYLQSL
jgi:23S rRNA pseudouridine1911/1915/1917 synthase